MSRTTTSGIRTDKLLVTTKFSPPRLGARSISRESLLAKLQGVQDHRVTLLVASPGFGKTTLLAQWRQVMLKSGADVAWLSLSVEDKLLPTFCVYLQGALQRLGIALGGSLAFDASMSEFQDDLVADIVGQIAELNRELFLVIDDYHLVMDPRSHRLMQRLLEYCPGNLHLVLASRTAPPLNLGRLRVMGQVLEVDCAELPFTATEVRDFFEQNLNTIKLGPEELHQINELCGGWPASLQLILLMLKNNPDARTALRDLAWKSDDLQAYLSEDVLQHLPHDLAEFMESLSVCRRFNASLATALTGRDDSLELLRRMDDENILTFRVDTEDRLTWYRFHPLFAEFLGARLNRRSPETIVELHGRAARWLGQQDHLAEAVRHAIQSGDTQLAVDLIGRVTQRPLDLDYVRPLLRLLDRLPRELLAGRPHLLCLYCLCHTVTGQPGKAEAYLAQLQPEEIARSAELAHNLPLIRAAIALQQDRTEQIVEMLEGYLPLPGDHSIVRYSPLTLMSFALAAEGRFEEALHYIDTYPVPPADRNDEVAMLGENGRLLCRLFEGYVKDVEESASALLSRAISLHGHRSNSADLCAATVAELYRELDRVDDAREALANRTAVMQWALPSLMLRATLCRARLDLLQDSPAQALAFLERQERHFLRIGQERLTAHVLAEEVRIALLCTDRTLAERLQERLENLAAMHEQAVGFRAEIPVQAALARSRLQLARGYPERALDALATVIDFSQRFARRQWLVTALLIKAQALDDLRQGDAVEATLDTALAQGETLGLLRTFIDEGAPIQKLLEQYQRSGHTSRYLERLLEHFPTQQGASKGGETQDSRAASGVLTPRETVILQLIGEAMSNKRIALTLNISLETVKWNLKNIYVKLGVSSRYDALSWARKHNLI